MRSTSELRQLYAPACSARQRGGFEDAYRALDACFRAWSYKPKAGETYAYSCRRITGGSGYSLHAYREDNQFRFWTGVSVTMAVAVDVNSTKNPYGARLVTDMPRPMVEAILAIRTVSGAQVWGWGGNYSRNKDAMHFELVCSPAELRTGINWQTVRGVPQLSAEQPSEEEEEVKPYIIKRIQTGAFYVVDTETVTWIGEGPTGSAFLKAFPVSTPTGYIEVGEATFNGFKKTKRVSDA